MTTSGHGSDKGNSPEPRSDVPHWAKPFKKLEVSDLPSGASSLNVEGRRVVGPLQGFGQMWQKTYRVRLSGVQVTPAEVVTFWKENLPTLMPPNSRFYPSLAGVQPGEVVLIKGSVGGILVSTGVMVLFADDESFAVMTPEGHPESGFNTFSAYEEEGCTVAQVQSLARANDPIFEFGFRFLGGSKLQEEIWQHLLGSLAAHFAVEGQVQLHKTCVDPKVQWSAAKNIWHNAGIRSTLYTLAAPLRWMAKPFKRGRP